MLSGSASQAARSMNQESPLKTRLAISWTVSFEAPLVLSKTSVPLSQPLNRLHLEAPQQRSYRQPQLKAFRHRQELSSSRVSIQSTRVTTAFATLFSTPQPLMLRINASEFPDLLSTTPRKTWQLNHQECLMVSSHQSLRSSEASLTSDPIQHPTLTMSSRAWARNSILCRHTPKLSKLRSSKICQRLRRSTWTQQAANASTSWERLCKTPRRICIPSSSSTRWLAPSSFSLCGSTLAAIQNTCRTKTSNIGWRSCCRDALLLSPNRTRDVSTALAHRKDYSSGFCCSSARPFVSSCSSFSFAMSSSGSWLIISLMQVTEFSWS